MFSHTEAEHFAGLFSFFLCKIRLPRSWDRKGATLLCCDKVRLLPEWLLLKEALLTVVRHCCLLHFQMLGDSWEEKAKSSTTDFIGLAMVESKAKGDYVDLCVNFGG